MIVGSDFGVPAATDGLDLRRAPPGVTAGALITGTFAAPLGGPNSLNGSAGPLPPLASASKVLVSPRTTSSDSPVSRRGTLANGSAPGSVAGSSWVRELRPT